METTNVPPIRTVYILELKHLAFTYQHFVMGNDENEHFTSVAKILTADYSAGAELFYNFGLQEFFVRTWEIASLLNLPEIDILADVADIVQGVDNPLWLDYEIEDEAGDMKENSMLITYPHTEPIEYYEDMYIPLSMAMEISGEIYYKEETSLSHVLGEFFFIAVYFERELKSIGLFKKD